MVTLETGRFAANVAKRAAVAAALGWGFTP
jgi:hypothetical protein